MKINAYQCDRAGCGQQGTSLPHESHPEGWIIVFGPTFQEGVRVGSSSWIFCSWNCASDTVTMMGAIDDIPAIARVT